MADSYVEINLTRLSNNVRAILEKYPEYKSYIGVVKGDAYGHGMRAVKALHNGGLRYFAVSSLEEAFDLRKYNAHVPVLCLEPVAIERLGEAADLDLTGALAAEAVSEAIKRAVWNAKSAYGYPAAGDLPPM